MPIHHFMPSSGGIKFDAALKGTAGVKNNSSEKVLRKQGQFTNGRKK
jgi:hypothetical protein